jgi:hypothetical protein
MRRRALCSTALVAMLVVVLAAPAGAANTPKQWRTKADAVCKAAGSDLSAAATAQGLTGAAQPTIDQIHAYAVAAAPIYRQAFDDIEAIAVPSKLKAKVKKLLVSFRSAVDKMATAASLAEYSANFAPASKQAKALGLKDCAG